MKLNLREFENYLSSFDSNFLTVQDVLLSSLAHTHTHTHTLAMCFMSSVNEGRIQNICVFRSYF
jgi:hypothetical protein